MESLVVAYQSLGDYQKAIEYNEKLLKIAQEIGDRSTMEISVVLHHVTIKKPLTIRKTIENCTRNRSSVRRMAAYGNRLCLPITG